MISTHPQFYALLFSSVHFPSPCLLPPSHILNTPYQYPNCVNYAKYHISFHLSLFMRSIHWLDPLPLHIHICNHYSNFCIHLSTHTPSSSSHWGGIHPALLLVLVLLLLLLLLLFKLCDWLSILLFKLIIVPLDSWCPFVNTAFPSLAYCIPSSPLNQISYPLSPLPEKKNIGWPFKISKLTLFLFLK